jgi:hypothetical protein
MLVFFAFSLVSDPKSFFGPIASWIWFAAGLLRRGRTQEDHEFGVYIAGDRRQPLSVEN